MRNVTHRALAVLLAALLAAGADGCVSVSSARVPLTPSQPTGEVNVAIYETPSDEADARPLSTPVLAELVAAGPDGARPVARSMASRWSAPGLPPGTYRLRVSKRLDENGDVVRLSQPADRRFEVRAGERTDLRLVLRKVPGVWIALAAVTVVALVILSIHLAKEGKIPVPHHLPPPPPIAVVLFPGGRDAEAGPPLEVAEAFPSAGSVVAARRVTVSFLLTRPLDPSALDPAAVQALGSLSGDLPGTVSYLSEEQLLRFAPERDFTPGETVTVTVDLSRLRGLGGGEGAGRISTRFRVAK